jgi:hypothetical protein
MKWPTLQHHKEAAMLCEEGMTIIEARSALLVPQSTKLAASTKIESNVRKIDKHCTNCGMTNQIMETCRKKRKKTIVATTEATQPS